MKWTSLLINFAVNTLIDTIFHTIFNTSVVLLHQNANKFKNRNLFIWKYLRNIKIRTKDSQYLEYDQTQLNKEDLDSLFEEKKKNCHIWSEKISSSLYISQLIIKIYQLSINQGLIDPRKQRFAQRCVFPTMWFPH